MASEFELHCDDEYHASAIKVNTGRNTLEYILKARHYGKLYLLYYICDSILELLAGKVRRIL